MIGYEKSELGNISDKALRTMQDVAAGLLALDDDALVQAVNGDELLEIGP